MEVGEKFPKFELPDENGDIFGSDSLDGIRYVIYFYPKDGSSGCTQEALDFNARYAKLMMMNIPVLGVSPDSPATHNRFREKNGIKLKLLSDTEHILLKEAGAWGPKKLYGREYEGVIRSTFIVGKDGVVEAAWKNVKVKGHVDAVYEKIRTLTSNV